MFDNDVQFLKAWTLRNDDGFTWFYDAWKIVQDDMNFRGEVAPWSWDF